MNMNEHDLVKTFSTFSIKSYCLPRVVVDKWILGKNPHLGLVECRLQNDRDRYRMKYRDYRNLSQRAGDNFLRLQHILYPSQTIYAIVFAHMLQKLKVFCAQYTLNHLNLQLLQDADPLSCEMFGNGRIFMNKRFRICRITVHGSVQTLLRISASVHISDSTVCFQFENF